MQFEFPEELVGDFPVDWEFFVDRWGSFYDGFVAVGSDGGRVGGAVDFGSSGEFVGG